MSNDPSNYRQMIEKYKETLDSMRVDRDKWRSVYEEARKNYEGLDAAVDGLESFLDTSSKAGPNSGKYSNMSLPDAIMSFLDEVGEPRTYTQIADALLEGGFETEAKNLYQSVSSTIIRMAKDNGNRLEKVGRALWRRLPEPGADRVIYTGTVVRRHQPPPKVVRALNNRQTQIPRPARVRIRIKREFGEPPVTLSLDEPSGRRLKVGDSVKVSGPADLDAGGSYYLL